MGQTCTICAHPQLLEIDAAIAADEPIRATARFFGATEAALRRHKAAHLLNTPEEGPEMVHSGTTQPVATQEDPEPQEDARSVARRRYEAEEQDRRAGRLASLEAEEQDRRDRERRELERAAFLEAARAQADELAARRAVVEDRADELAAALTEALEEAEDLYGRETRVRSPAGLLPSGIQLFPSFVGFWLQVKLGRFSPAGGIPPAMDLYGGAPLRERDPLAKTADARVLTPPPTAA